MPYAKHRSPNQSLRFGDDVTRQDIDRFIPIIGKKYSTRTLEAYMTGFLHLPQLQDGQALVTSGMKDVKLNKVLATIDCTCENNEGPFS